MTAARGQARIGCSGWSYRDWRGIVYPADAPTTRWFDLYATRFDTVEINNTFYRLPTEAAVDRWCAQAPPGFCYSVKVGQFGSHRKKLLDAQTWLPRHLERIGRLGAHLGPNLVQLPPRWKRDVARLDDFLSVAPTSMRWALEVRDRSWLHDDVFEVLQRHGAALCIHDLLDDHPWERTAGWTYLRFHGPHATQAAYHGRYGERRLSALADRLDPWLVEGTDVYGYFNNDHEGDAVFDAADLRRLLVRDDATRSGRPASGKPKTGGRRHRSQRSP